MPHTFEIQVPPGKKRERLDLFLTHQVENATRNKVQRAIRDGAVLVNGRAVRASHQVVPGEVIRVTLSREPPQEALPEPLPLDILYEDAFLLIVNKPAGMVVHPAYGNRTGTLVNALLYHCRALSTQDSSIRPGIVHRIDKNTSGLLVVAKNDSAHAHLARQFARHTIDREYQAIVWGTFRESSGLIETELGRSRSDRKKMSVVSHGRAAVTGYSVLEQFRYLSLLKLLLRTGRTHQIRVHLAHIHHPVFGDPDYSGRQLSWGATSARERAEIRKLLGILPRQALHAKTLGFVHPATGQRVIYDSPLPDDMSAALQLLRGTAASD
jgi:23S rRNA pseudouridine1911/1915/1917 synthase